MFSFVSSFFSVQRNRNVRTYHTHHGDTRGSILLVICIVVMLCMFLSCIPEVPPSSKVTSASQQHHSLDHTSYKIVVFADKSLSIATNDVPKVYPFDFDPLIEAIDKGGGELIVGTINHASKKHLARYRPHRPPTNPIQQSGESAAAFHKRIMRHQARVADYQGGNIDNTTALSNFKRTLNMLLDYSHLSSSDVAGAAEIAHMLHTERDDELTNAVRAVVFVTDGMNNGNPAAFPKKFSCPVYMVCSERNAHDLSRYNPEIVTSVAGAFRLILNQ